VVYYRINLHIHMDIFVDIHRYFELAEKLSEYI